MDDKLRKELSRENLNRLSSDFEVELLRLIKTLNLISQSKELYKNQVEEIESISNSLKLRINDFTIKLLEVEKSAREGARDYNSSFTSPGDAQEPTDYETLIREVNEFREKINAVDKDIERAKVEHLSKLDSFYSVYNLELKASQGELDTKLSDIRELLTESVPESPVQEPPHTESAPAPESPQAQGNGSDTKPMPEPLPEVRAPSEEPPSEFQRPRADNLPKRNINLSRQKAQNKNVSLYGSNGLMMGIIFLFFGALVGITTYYLLDYIGGEDSPTGMREEIYSDRAPEAVEEPKSETVSVSDTTSEPEKKISEPKEIEPKEVASAEDGSRTTSNSSLKSLFGTPVETASIDSKDTNDTSELYTVVGPGANVRSGPGINHSVATVVLEG